MIDKMSNSTENTLDNGKVSRCDNQKIGFNSCIHPRQFLTIVIKHRLYNKPQIFKPPPSYNPKYAF